MQAKRFIVPNMRQGLKTIREVLGADAMIISSKSTQEGLEIIASVALEPELHSLSDSASVLLGAQTKTKQDALLDLYKEKMIDEPLRKEKETIAASREELIMRPVEQASVDIKMQNPLPSTSSNVRIEEVYPQKDVLQTLNQELASIREVLSSQVSDIVWKNYGLENAYQSQVVKTLMATGVSKDLSVRVASSIYQSEDIKQMLEKAVHSLANQVIQLKKPIQWESNIKVVVGPGGCGKTKSIGKLLSTLIEQYDPNDIALVSFNEQQLGQFDELLVYASIFNMSASLAVDVASLDIALNRFKDKKVVLVDLTTPDVDTLQIAMEQCKHLPFKFEWLGVIPTTWERESLNRWLDVYSAQQINHVIATKLDEASMKGKLFDIILKHQFSIQTIFESPKITESFKAISEDQLIDCLREIYDKK